MIRDVRLVRFATVSLVSLLVVLFAFPFARSGTVEPRATAPAFAAHLDERIPALMASYDIPGVGVALVHDGEAAWTDAYGYADLETGRETTPETVFRAASISKAVTAWGVLRLVEDGSVALDDPIGQHIRRWTFPDPGVEAVTVRQLLSHSGGLPLGTLDDEYSPYALVPSLADSLSGEVRLERTPGVRFAYSNTGFNLLELLIEEVRGQDFAAYMAAEVLAPLGMHDSTFDWGPAVDARIAVGHDLHGRPVPAYVYPDKASGGLLTTVGDVAAFVAAGMTGDHAGRQDVLGSDALRDLYEPAIPAAGPYAPVFDDYGLGHFLETLPSGERAAWHGGQGHGWMTHFHAVPESGEGIVILANSQRAWPLIAAVLSDWATWSGFTSVGMGRISLALYGLWAVVAGILFAALWQVSRVVEGVVAGRRHFGPLSAGSRPVKAMQVGVSACSLVGALWFAAQDYTLVSALFPVAARWLVGALLALGLAALGSAVFPRAASQRGADAAATTASVQMSDMG